MKTIDPLRTRDPRIGLGTRISASIADAKVLILGTGSVGSFTAWNLASQGAGSIVLADRETLAVDNVRRHIGSLDEVGISKTEVVGSFLGERFPLLDVRPRRFCFRSDLESLRRGLSECEIAIVAIDDEGLKHLIDAIARSLNRPCVFLGVHGDGWGVEAILSDVSLGTPCYGCSADSMGRIGIDCSTNDQIPSYAIPSQGSAASEWRFADLRAIQAASALGADLASARLEANRGAGDRLSDYRESDASTWFMALRSIREWSLGPWEIARVERVLDRRCFVCGYKKSVDYVERIAELFEMGSDI